MKHDIVMEQFEQHLEGTASRAFYQHLDACPPCREEVERMAEMSGVLRNFRLGPDTVPAVPSLGFYNRVAGQIVEKETRSAWGLFSPGVAFFRRIAFASLLVLAALGSYLISSETGFDSEDAVSIMAQHDSAADHAAAADRDRLLVTMATYHE